MSEPDQAALIARLVDWHTHRFPLAQATHVGLKLCAEAGEVADAIVGDSGVNSGTGDGDVGAEAADVFIALTVLLSRWYPDVDLMAEVERKVTLLETPGAHKSSATEPDAPLTCSHGSTTRHAEYLFGGAVERHCPGPQPKPSKASL